MGEIVFFSFRGDYVILVGFPQKKLNFFLLADRGFPGKLRYEDEIT